MNKVVLIGRITNDLEPKKFGNNGDEVLNFTLAVDRRMSKQDITDFIHCVAWRKTAQLIYLFAGKGLKIAIEGRIQTENYTDKNGNNRHKTTAVVENVEFLEWKDKNTSTVKENINVNPSVNETGSIELNEDDLPW